MYLYYNFFIDSSVDGHLGSFHVLAIVNSAAVNNGIHVYSPILVSSVYMPRSGIAGSYGGFIPSFFKESPYRLSREGNGNPLQYSCLENPMDRGSWQATVYAVASIRHDLATKERESGEKGMLLHCWWECKLITATVKDGIAFP